MRMIIDLIDDGDFCSLSFLILIVIVAGAAMVNGKEKLHLRGKHAAAAAFVCYAAYGWYIFQPATAEDWIGITIRGAFAAGLVLGLSWIVLAVVVFAYRYTAENPIRTVRNRISRAKRQKAEQEETERRQREAEIREQQQREQAEREARQREREAKERAAKASEEAEHKTKFARTECELLYNGYATELESLLPSEEFEHFLKKHLSASQPPERIDRYATLLKKTIQRYLKIAKRRPSSFKNIPEIASHFQDVRKEIDELPYDEETKQTLVAHLSMAEEQAIERFLAQ